MGMTKTQHVQCKKAITEYDFICLTAKEKLSWPLKMICPKIFYLDYCSSIISYVFLDIKHSQIYEEEL